jgi:hypothetical protein
MEFIKKHYRLILLAIPVVSLIMHWYVFGLDLVGIHVWRQTETQHVINNFYREDMNILHPRVNNMGNRDRLLLLEFAVMQWIFALFFKVFGSHVVISRILSFIIGLFSAYGMFYLADRSFKNKGTAAIAAWTFSFSPLFYYYTLNPLPDNFAMCFAIWSVGLFYEHILTGKMKYVVWSAVCMGLSVMAKLPFVLFGAFMAAWYLGKLWRKEVSAGKVIGVAAIYLLAMAPAAAWYAWVIPQWKHMVVLKGVFDTKQSGSQMMDIAVGTLTSLLPELLINYGSVLFFVASFFFMYKNKVFRDKRFPLFFWWAMAVLFYYVFEMNTINLVHDYYLFPFLPLIFLMVAYGAAELLKLPNKVMRGFCMLCLCILPLTAFVRTYSRWDVATDPGFPKVFYTNKQEIRNLTPKDALVVAGGDETEQVYLYYIDRKGWTYQDETLDSARLGAFMRDGAQYLFTTNGVDSKEDIRSLLGEKIYDKENLRVYKLKR